MEPKHCHEDSKLDEAGEANLDPLRAGCGTPQLRWLVRCLGLSPWDWSNGASFTAGFRAVPAIGPGNLMRLHWWIC